MTATERLRAMLDERGVEHEDRWSGDLTYTKWQGIGGMWFLTHDSFGSDDKLLYIQGIEITPEQAIDATLGREKCAECAVAMGMYADSLCDPLKAELEELRERTERLLRTLRDGWHIEASWDGLRRFWYVGLTDEGVRERDEREATLGRETCKTVQMDCFGNPPFNTSGLNGNSTAC